MLFYYNKYVYFYINLYKITIIMKNFLNTPLGSFLKVFLVAILVQIVSIGSIYNLDVKGLINAAVISVIPVIINFLNPNDPRYGIGSQLKPNNDGK